MCELRRVLRKVVPRRNPNPSWLKQSLIYEVKVIAMRSGEWGECFFDDRLIHINKSLPLVDQIRTLIHEYCHANWPDLPENAILAKEETYWLALTGEVLGTLITILTS